MSAEHNKSVLNSMTKIVNQGNFDSLEEYLSEDFHYRASSGEEAHGIDEFKQLLSTYRKAFSDFNVTIKDLVAEGDKVVSVYTQQGTHQEPVLGIEPRGRSMSLPVIAVLTFEDSKATEMFEVFDTLELQRQLGTKQDQAEDQTSHAYNGGERPII